MTKGKGRGWHGESRRHAQAAMGQKTKKVAVKTVKWTPRTMSPEDFQALIKRLKTIGVDYRDLRFYKGKQQVGEWEHAYIGKAMRWHTVRLREDMWEGSIPQIFRQPPGYGSGKSPTIPEMDSWVYAAMEYRGQIRDPELRAEFDQYLDGYDIEENYGGKAALVNAMGEILDMSARQIPWSEYG